MSRIIAISKSGKRWEFSTQKEAANKFACSPATVRSKIRSGKALGGIVFQPSSGYTSKEKTRKAQKLDAKSALYFLYGALFGVLASIIVHMLG
jgi:hypothetical protein